MNQQEAKDMVDTWVADNQDKYESNEEFQDALLKYAIDQVIRESVRDATKAYIIRKLVMQANDGTCDSDTLH